MKPPDPSTFLSGQHGDVGRSRRAALRRAGDRALDLWLRASGALRRIDRLAEQMPIRDVLIASIHRPESAELGAAVGELRSTRHNIRVAVGSTADPRFAGGKFPNLNVLLAGESPADWLFVVDDDVTLPPRFLDRFIALAERFELDLAQPAQTLASHAAWAGMRRRPLSVVRETRFVEIGPVTAFSRKVAAELLPFPALRFGWGLDSHWAAVAAERGWRLGIADAVPVAHESRTVASGYNWTEAAEEAQRFLATRPHLPMADAPGTIAVHRRA
jgi:hypothetical protein